MTSTPAEVSRFALSSRWPPVIGVGPQAGLYVMVTADGSLAKVGALESVANAENRLLGVSKKQRDRSMAVVSYPISLAVVAELEDIVLPHDSGYDERWAKVEHIESALRLALARQVGRLHRWTDWIHVERLLTPRQWTELVQHTWHDVDQLGVS